MSDAGTRGLLVGGRGLAVLVALLGAMGCGGCSPAYVLRSAWEEGRILWRREPIPEVLARPDVDGEVRSKLELVLAVRRFAEDSLGLKVGGAYSSYAEVPPGALLQVVSASRRTELVPYEWWFPIVGHVTYKGYFSRADAEAEARDLEAKGWDTWVRGSVAFSTLGWFDDPVLSNWMRGSRTRIADLVLHELLHRTTYLSGQTAFNESFANFVGGRGAIAFFASTDGPDAESTREAEAQWASELRESATLGRTMAELRMLYAEAATQAWSEEAVLAARSEIFSRAAELGDPAKLNNAVLLAREAYLDRLPAFEDAYVATGSDLRAAIGRIRAASEGSEDPFAAVAEIAAEGAGGGVPEHPGAGGAPAGAFLSPRGRWPAPMTGIQTKSG